MRRAADITDLVDKTQLKGRPVFLVDVLNELCASLQIEVVNLWDLSDG